MNQELDTILEEKFTNTFRKGYCTVKGYTFPVRYLDLKEAFDKFDVNEQDIWICSFPKCGKCIINCKLQSVNFF